MMFNIKELIYCNPSGKDVAWEYLNYKDWVKLQSYVDWSESLYFAMNLEEQFMFLCFVILSEET